MKISNLTFLILLFAGSVIVDACQKEISCESCQQNNMPPIAVSNQTCSQLSPIPVACDNSIRQQICSRLVPVGILSQGRFWMSVAFVGKKIVFAGGHKNDSYSDPSSRVDIYDTVTQTWSTAELSVSRYGMATIVAGNKIFFAGGATYDDADNWIYYSEIDVYDISTNAWSVLSLSESRGYIAAAVIGDKVFFAGGETVGGGNGDVSDKVDIYNLTTNTMSVELLSEPRGYMTAVVANSKVYFAGGAKAHLGYVSDIIDIYDNATNSWSKSYLNEPKAAFAGIAVDNKIYWAGGYGGTPINSLSCKVEIKDINTWSSSTTQLFKPGQWRINAGENAVVKDNKIVFLRQWPYNNGQVSSPEKYFDIYNISSNTWTIGVLPESASVTSGSVIAVGNTIYLATGWGYKTSSQLWKLEF